MITFARLLDGFTIQLPRRRKPPPPPRPLSRRYLAQLNDPDFEDRLDDADDLRLGPG